MSFLALIPLRVWLSLGAAVALFAGLAWVDHRGFVRGEEKTNAAWEAKYQANLAEIGRLKARQAEVVEKVVTVYKDRVKVVKEKGDEIVREIPILVGMDSPLLAGSYRVLHDAAATGSMPSDPAGAAETADPVTAAALLTTTAENYTTCRSTAEQLTALQSILKGKP